MLVCLWKYHFEMMLMDSWIRISSTTLFVFTWQRCNRNKLKVWWLYIYLLSEFPFLYIFCLLLHKKNKYENCMKNIVFLLRMFYNYFYQNSLQFTNDRRKKNQFNFVYGEMFTCYINQNKTETEKKFLFNIT